MKKRSRILARLAEGFIGALVLTLAHETTRKKVAGAPRLDSLGERAIVEGSKLLGVSPPRGRKLRRWALAGDLVANTLYFALFTGGRSPVGGSLLGGLLAGGGAIGLPKHLGLGKRPRGDLKKQALTLGLFALGGLAAGAIESAASQPKKNGLAAH